MKNPETPKALNLFKAVALGVAIPPTIFLYKSDADEIRRRFVTGADAASIHQWFQSRTGGGLGERLVLRPSYSNEDHSDTINAGNYTSYIDVENKPERICEALAAFVEEWKTLGANDEQSPELIVQQYIPRQVHGVLQSIDPVTVSRDYFAVATTTCNLDVTAGAPDTKTAFVRIEKYNGKELEIAFGESDLSHDALVDILEAASSLEGLFGSSPIDVEFGHFDGKTFIFQVRPATVSRKPEGVVEFQNAPLVNIAPAFKEIYSRHAKKRKLLYNYLRGTDILYPKSFVVDREATGSIAQLKALVRADQVYIPKHDIVRPRRKEDFNTTPSSDLERLLESRNQRHVLVTEAPTSAKSGYLHIADVPLIEFVEGEFSDFERGGQVHRLSAADLHAVEPTLIGLHEIANKLSAYLPGGVAEWIQDRDNRLWLYDATLPKAGAQLVNLQAEPLTGECIQLSKADVSAIQSRTKYPLSVYAEEEELRSAFAIELSDVVGEIPFNRNFHVSADYPATALAVFTLFPSFAGFQFGAGSVLCHLALICYSKGLAFRVET